MKTVEIRRSLWSLWTKPAMSSEAARWASERHHLYAWALSFERARQHFPDTALVTDARGKRWLVDMLGLPFDEVSTELDALDDAHPRFWALGKLYAYRAQRAPFVHVDNDVFLWQRLPPALERAPLLAQNPEYFEPWTRVSYYQPDRIDELLVGPDAWLPEAWRWYARRPGFRTAACCGIFGGCDTEFIRAYAEQAIRMVEHPGNRSGWADFLGIRELDPNVHVEQYLLSACIAWHGEGPGPDWPGLEIRYLFETHWGAFDPDQAARVGYTHLIGGAKRNEQLMERLERRVQTEYPHYYERIQGMPELIDA